MTTKPSAEDLLQAIEEAKERPHVGKNSVGPIWIERRANELAAAREHNFTATEIEQLGQFAPIPEGCWPEIRGESEQAPAQEAIYQTRLRLNKDSRWHDVCREDYNKILGMDSMETRVLYAAPQAPAVSVAELRELVDRWLRWWGMDNGTDFKDCADELKALCDRATTGDSKNTPARKAGEGGT